MQTMWVILGSQIFYDGVWLTAGQLDEIAYEYRMKIVSGEIERKPALEALIERWNEIKSRKE